MREKILELKIDTTQVLRENTDALYLTEHDVLQILSLISKEIEKVENHLCSTGYAYYCVEDFRQKILSLLKE